MNNKNKFDWSSKNTWSRSAKNTLWCLIGCSIGDFGTIYYFQITPHSLSIPLVMLIAIINGIITSIVLETFIIDLSDNQNTPKPKVTVKPDAGTQDIKDKTTSSQSVTSIGIEIQFDFNSNKIRTDQSEKMSRLAAALADEINAGARFAVIGHTDGKGSDAYNCRLSEKRAASVTTRLLLNGAQNHLRSVGAGEALLKTTVEPDSAKNRRVSFLKLGENEVATLNAFQSLCN